MRKRLKLLAVCAVAASVLTELPYLSVDGFIWHRREVSSSLIGELKRLEVGKATEVQVRALSDRYGGTYSPAHIQDQVPQPARYDVAVTSPHILIADSTRTLPGLRE